MGMRKIGTLLLIVAAVASAQDKPSVADELGAYYADGETMPRYAQALDGLGGNDAAVRKREGSYLLALLEALLADESNGRAKWQATPFWGGGSVNPARELRKTVAEAIAKSPATAVELVPALRFLLEKERLAPSVTAAAEKLANIDGKEADQLVADLVSAPHPLGRVLEIAVAEHGRRKGDLEAVKALIHHHRKTVRELARGLLPLDQPPPPFDPALTYTKALRADLTRIHGLARIPVSNETPFVTLEDGRRGFLVAKGLLLGDHLAEVAFPIASATTTVPLEKEAARVAAIRAQPNADEQFSERGMLTGQFQARGMSPYEAFLGAVLLARADAKNAALVLLPVLENLADDRWPLEIVRDRWGTIHERSMLEAFAGDRDYPKASALAKLLVERFPDFGGRARAEKLARELESRKDDFVALTLPTAEQWEKERVPLTRPQTIEYLARRLRLLNCFQWGQPGGVSYGDSQYAEPCGLANAAWGEGRGKTPVINPFSELEKLDLGVGDIPVLAPFLADDAYIPTVSFWRDFHPARTLHQVDWVIGALIDTVAKQDLCRVRELDGLDAAGKKARIAEVSAWAKANAGKSAKERLLDILRKDQNWYAAEHVVPELVEKNVTEAVPLILLYLDRADVNEYQRESIFRSCSLLDGKAAVASATKFLADPRPGVKIEAGVIVYRSDKAKGRKAIAKGLAEGNYSTLSPSTALHGVQALLEGGAKEDVEAARVVFDRDYFTNTWDHERLAIVEAFGDLGAYVPRFYLKMLKIEGTQLGGTNYSQPVAHVFGREVFNGVGKGKVGAKAWPEEGTRAEKDAAVKEAIRWLEGEIERIEKDR